MENKKKKDYNSVFLPSTRDIDVVTLEELTWLLYGQPGVGKTTFAASMDKALFLCTMPGQKYIKAYKRPVTSWLMFKQYVDLLDSKTPEKYSTIVIDTVDQLYTLCKKYIYKKRNIEHVSDEEWGKGWEMVADEFRLWVLRLALLPYGTVFISHDKTIEKRGRITRTSKIVPSLQKQAQAIVNPICDVIAYCGFSEESADKHDSDRIIMFEPSETIEAKDWTGKLPHKCAFDYKEVEAYLLGHKTTKVKTTTMPGQGKKKKKKKK